MLPNTGYVYRLSCNLCKNTYHTQCTNVSKNNFRTMTDSIKTLWICHHCVAVFPFNHIVDDEKILKSCCNDNGVTKRLCHELLFNPFEKNNDINDNIPNSEYDPDANFYDTQIPSSLTDSKYFSSSEFNMEISKSSNINQLSMLHCNIRSSNKNANDLSIELGKLNHDFNIIALSETWLNATNTEINGFPDYNHVFNFRKSKRGGGVSLLLQNHLKYHEIEELFISSEVLECLFVEIEMSHKNIIIGCVYRPPNSNITDFNEKILDILQKINKLKRHAYILGDFNIDLLKSSSHTQHLISLTRYFQLHSFP